MRSRRAPQPLWGDRTIVAGVAASNWRRTIFGSASFDLCSLLRLKTPLGKKIVVRLPVAGWWPQLMSAGSNDLLAAGSGRPGLLAACAKVAAPT